MTPDDFKTWSARLGDLSPEQRKDVTNRLRHGLGVKAAPKLDEDWLLLGLCRAMTSKGVISSAALPTLLRSNGAKAYGAISATLRADLEKLLPDKNVRAARVAMAILVGESLIKYLEISHVPVTGGNVLLNAHHALAAIDRAFPGYAQSGMLPLVLSRHFYDSPPEV